MSTKYFSLVTRKGRAVEATSKATGTPINFSHIAVGDGGGQAITPSAEMESLRQERWRGELNDLYIDPDNPDVCVAEAVMPDTDGGFTVREIGLFTDTGIMYAVGSVAETEKPVLSEGSAKSLYLRFYVEVSSEATVNLLIDPAKVLATRDYVDRVVVVKIAEHNEDPASHEDLRTAVEEVQEALGHFVPKNRTLHTREPLRIDGGDSADLSEDRILSIEVDGVLGNNYHQIVLTSTPGGGKFLSPIEGWLDLQVIGAGGAGATGSANAEAGGIGGLKGGDTVVSYMDQEGVTRTITALGGSGGAGGSGFGCGSGGGGAGRVVNARVYLKLGQALSVSIGAGAVGRLLLNSNRNGTSGEGPEAGIVANVTNQAGNGAIGAGSGCTPLNYGGQTPGISGNGAINGTGYGSGGGAGGACYGGLGAAGGIGYQNGANGAQNGSKGGSGGPGAVIISWTTTTTEA
ncbi:phage tail protein [Desulfovibrio sp. OttesenSCG-928-G11]|nr:phage tail protein [Desulfovibrio sp. OttesenSCG-928-G11]